MSTRKTPAIARTVADLRAAVTGWQRAGERCALVPTMGSLHAGHLQLVRHGRDVAHRVVATIFINPKQFGEGEDLDTYPSDLDGDLAKLAELGTDLVYVPTGSEMYPQGFSTSIEMTGPASTGLEDKFRPDFFSGVATVVAKLFIQAGCDLAIFGEKDYQQLLVVRRMAADLDIPIEVIAAPTVRASDGLALSSRNAYLTKKERQTAPLIYATLNEVAAQIRAGTSPATACKEGISKLTAAGFKVDYLEARDAQTLEAGTDAPVRLLCAAWLGKTRLIDNIAV